MATDAFPPTQSNGHSEHAGIDPAKALPGTTFPPSDANGFATQANTTRKSQRGPQVKGRDTTITLYAPSDLPKCTSLPSLYRMMNAAFQVSHSRKDTLPTTIDRLQTEDQFTQEIGSDPWTFTYIVTYTGTDEVLGTASGQRWYGTKDVVEAEVDERLQTFKRKGASRPYAEEWELRLMAVDPSLQRQGIAGLLMRLVDEEVVRRFKAAKERDGEKGRGLVMLITSISEINREFYRRRGYVEDYEERFPIGWLGSKDGFGVVHMSRKLDT